MPDHLDPVGVRRGCAELRTQRVARNEVEERADREELLASCVVERECRRSIRIIEPVIAVDGVVLALLQRDPEPAGLTCLAELGVGVAVRAHCQPGSLARQAGSTGVTGRSSK